MNHAYKTGGDTMKRTAMHPTTSRAIALSHSNLSRWVWTMILSAVTILVLSLTINAQTPSAPDTPDTPRPPRKTMTGERVIEFNNLHRGELAFKGFTLSEETRLNLYAVGVAAGSHKDLNAYCWIIDAESREPVWVMDARDTDRYGRSRTLREIEDDLVLPAGKYEAYYYAGRTYNYNFDINWKDLEGLDELFRSLGEALEDIGRDLQDEEYDSAAEREERAREYERLAQELEERTRQEVERNGSYHWDSNGDWGISNRELDELRFEINSTRKTFTTFDPETAARELTVVDLSKARNSDRLRKGITLSRTVTLKIRACGEYSEGGNIFVDHGWIVNADTRERVWEMDKWSTRYAGGARKNRHAAEEVTLQAGNYLVYFMTDDSHSFEEWNAPPPYDPLNYGIVLLVKSPSDKQYVTDYKYDSDATALFALDRVRNDRYESQGFSLKEPTQLRIYAMGEFAFNDFADYGWIENAETMEVVWEMTEDNTNHAGGAVKNRVFDDVITLPAGNYMAHYVTDGSHSYRSWNAEAPFDEDKWGMTVYLASKSADKSKVDLFSDLPLGEAILADLTRVGDDEYISRDFELTNPTSVHIFALGEGSNGTMYDYGWIEEAETGKVVWQMRYRRTRHAGGADKNRMENVVIELPAGRYEVFFETDGSHSFPRFNASQPRTPQKWGITISKK